MKNIKLRIVYLILCSALLLFALFMLEVNLIIPTHFVREAKKALISEAQYQNRTIPYTDDGSFFDDGWNDTEEHFLTPSIVFLELEDGSILILRFVEQRLFCLTHKVCWYNEVHRQHEQGKEQQS